MTPTDSTSKAVILAVVVLLSTTTVARQTGVTTVHIATSTHPSGLSDATSPDRQKAIEEIRKRLASQRNLRLVPASANPVIVITVTSVEREQVWMPTPLAEVKVLTPGEPLPEGTRPAMVARAELTYGTFKTSFAEAAGAFRGNAASNLGRSIERWFRDNARTLATLPRVPEAR